MIKPGPLAITLSAGLLLLATALSLLDGHQPRERSFTSQLKAVLPLAPAGWSRTVRPVAETIEMQNAVSKVLNFDDAVFADYTDGTIRLSLYMAYWTPAKMSFRLVAGHTPDVCWIGNGWTKTGSADTARFVLPDGRALPPAEARTFRQSNHTEHVWFWHLVDGHVFSYGTKGMPPWHAFITDLFRRDFDPRGEQFFIRLSANAPITDPRLRPAAETIMANLPLPEHQPAP